MTAFLLLLFIKFGMLLNLNELPVVVLLAVLLYNTLNMTGEILL